MKHATVYIDACSRTQNVLSLKWALKGAGFAIGSTWHDQSTPFLRPENHWNEFRMAELAQCDELFVMLEGQLENSANLAAMAALALARGMQVTWVGPSLPALDHFHGLRHFVCFDDLTKQMGRPDLPLAA